MNPYYMSSNGYNEQILVVPWSYVITEFNCTYFDNEPKNNIIEMFIFTSNEAFESQQLIPKTLKMDTTIRFSHNLYKLIKDRGLSKTF